ncbi:MAG: hypothetical protein ABF991_00405 [Liquorilactobacillus hordei]|uniref:hypothetical protein n=1 Tax=Liquorilactobacillus hordei TaxID=468911 RepID=UPI0039EA541D
MSIFNWKNKKTKSKESNGLIPATKAREMLDRANELKKLTMRDIRIINYKIKDYAKTGSNKFTIYNGLTECPLEVAVSELKEAGYKPSFNGEFVDFYF